MIVVYDSVVVGGGPAGLSAALQLARFNRRVLLLDSGMGRSTYHQTNHNYLGFPGGVGAQELRELGRRQVREYPVALVDEAAVAVESSSGTFVATTASGNAVRGRTLVLATGVRDHFPIFPEWESYVGRSLFWCIVCDGYGTRGKSVVALGNDDEAAVTAMQFLEFTRRVVLVTNAPERRISAEAIETMEDKGVRLVDGQLRRLYGHDGIVHSLELSDGQTFDADLVFSLQGSTPNSELASGLGVATNAQGYVITDESQQTSIGGVFAAGDVTRDGSHQVATAVHEGLTAATAAQYYLYEPWQRHEAYKG